MDEKVKSILSYVFGFIGGLIVLYVVKDNERNTKIHAAQSIVISLSYTVLTSIYRMSPIVIPFFTYGLSGIYCVVFILGIIKACNNENPEIPIIGDVAKSLFGSKIDE